MLTSFSRGSKNVSSRRVTATYSRFGVMTSNRRLVRGRDLQLRCRLVQMIEQPNGDVGDQLHLASVASLLDEGGHLDRHWRS